MKIKETIASLIYFFFPLRERKKKKKSQEALGDELCLSYDCNFLRIARNMPKLCCGSVLKIQIVPSGFRISIISEQHKLN